MMSKISRDELHAKLERGDDVAILEALPEKYYRTGHLPGARLMPHDAVADLAPSLVPDKSAEIVVYCASATCRNSEIAATRLTELGYRNVRAYAEGKADWVAAGLPLESAKTPA